VPEISVVVCTYRRAEKLTACLDALARQTIRDRVEVIVVDDGPDDATMAVAARYDVRLIRHAENRGLAAARNTGIEAATAPVVAFTDDDCVPADNWLEALLDPYRSADVIGVGGGVEALQHETIVHRYLAETNRLAPLEIELGVSSSLAYRTRLYLRRNRHGGGTLPGTRAVYSLVGANMSFRRDALVAIGMFDGRITFGGEDEDVCRRLRDHFRSERFVFTARAVIAHDFDGDLRDTLRRSFQYGAGSARGYLKNADQGPTLFPVPVLVAGLLVLGVLGARRRWTIAAAAMVPFVVFSRWPVEALRHRRLEVLAFPVVQLLEEAAHDAGFAKGWARLRREYRRHRDERAPDA
jgi:glycosyltransferase involved in cell wall biosynthesis